MELIKTHIYGFGSLHKVSLEFTKGFQVIWVKDENERQTLIQFLLDILFGQRSSIVPDASFTENYYKYTPWHTTDYRGYLAFNLSKGEIIHLQRIFGPTPSLKVYRGLDVKDITDTLPKYPSGEIAFAQHYLDLSREIFSEVFLIYPETMKQLETAPNGSVIRNHLIGLIDTGTTTCSIQSVIRALEEYLQTIGTERTFKRPYNLVREQLERGIHEYEQAKSHLEQINQKKITLKEYKRLLNIAHEEYKQLHDKLQYAHQYALWRKKNDAKALREKLDELIKHSFSLANYRNFPLEYKSQVSLCERNIQQAEAQKQKLQREVDQITDEINELEYKIHHSSFIPIDFMVDYQEKFEDFQRRIVTNDEVLKGMYLKREGVRKQIENIEKAISALPEVVVKDDKFYQKVDFTVDLYRSSQKETQKSELQLNQLQAEFSKAKEEIKPYETLFSDVPHFPELVEDYLKYKDKPEEERQELENKIREAEIIAHNIKTHQPMHIIFACVCLFLGLALFALYMTSHKQESLWFASAVGLGFIYFSHSFLTGYQNLKQIALLKTKLHEEIQKIISVEYIETHPITALLKKANLEHPRELQGLYDEYCAWLKRLEDLTQQIREAEQLFSINQSRTADLFLELKKLFRQVNLNLEDDQHIEQYRREVYLLQNEVRTHNMDIWKLKEKCQGYNDSISLKEDYSKKIQQQIQNEILNQIGDKLVNMGILQPGESLSRETFRRYYQLEEEYYRLKTKVTELRDKRLFLHQQLQRIEDEISKNQEQIKEILDLAGISSLSEWKDKCARAEEAHTIFSRIEQTNLQLQQLLENETLEDLEKSTQDFVPSEPPGNEQELQDLLTQKREEIDQLQKDIQSLETHINEMMGKYRPLNEIIEEKNYYEMQWNILQYERESVLLALSILNQLSKYRYQKIASHLQKEMSNWVEKLTNGKWKGVVVEPEDLTLKVVAEPNGEAVPLEKISEQTLIEQLYFAMRSVITKIPHFIKESLPLLLDEPFTQYDYPQLIQSISNLKILGEGQQIILITNHHDTLAVAKNLNIPVIEVQVLH